MHVPQSQPYELDHPTQSRSQGERKRTGTDPVLRFEYAELDPPVQLSGDWQPRPSQVDPQLVTYRRDEAPSDPSEDLYGVRNSLFQPEERSTWRLNPLRADYVAPVTERIASTASQIGSKVKNTLGRLFGRR